jgi:hypothetical protein
MRARLLLFVCIAALSAGCGADTEDLQTQPTEQSPGPTSQATAPRDDATEDRRPHDNYRLRLNTVVMCDAIRASVSMEEAGIGPRTAPAVVARNVIENTEVSIQRLRTLRPPAKHEKAHEALVSAKEAIMRTNEEVVRNPPAAGDPAVLRAAQRAARQANQLLVNALTAFPGGPPDPLAQGARRKYMDAQCRTDATHDDTQRKYVERALRAR